jgi:hypothetical protein
MRNIIRWAIYLYGAFGIAVIVGIVYVFGDFIDSLKGFV